MMLMGGVVLLRRRVLLRSLVAALAGLTLVGAGLAWLSPHPGSAPRPTDPGGAPQPARPLLVVAGGSPTAPAYTLPAFRRALVDGAEALALPLCFTADGEAMVYAATDLSATTDGWGPLSLLPLTDVQALDAGYRFTAPGEGLPFRGHGLQIPRLEEVLASFPGTMVLLEVTDPSPAPAHLERLARTVRHWKVSATILLGARTQPVATALRRLLPEVTAVSTPAETVTFLRFSRFGLTGLVRPAYAVLLVPPGGQASGRGGAPGVPLTASQVAAARRRGLAVLAGPVAALDEARRLVTLGVDGLLLSGPAAAAPRLLFSGR